jgi:pimeloyl-ACP methyl ester carboxylesterase
MRHQGIADLSKITTAELDAYLVLLRRTDKGRAFLKIMRGFELTRAKRDLYVGLLRSRAFPVQIIWGRRTRHLRSPHSVRSLAEPPAWTISTGYPANISCKKISRRRSPS